MPHTGDLLQETVTLVHPDSSPYLGATWSVVTSHDGDGTAFTPTVTDLGDGSYRVSYQTTLDDPPGSWYALIQADDPFHQQYEVEWDVAPGYLQLGVVAPTRAELRQTIASDLGDYRALTATGGSTTTLTDPFELAEYTDTYVGGYLLVTGGTGANVGQIARVTASSLPATTITVAPELPMPVTAGDTADLYNLRGNGWRLPEYNRAIAAAVRQIRRSVLLSVQSVGIAFDADTPFIAVPDGWIGVWGVHVPGDTEADGFALPPAKYEGGPGWHLRPQDGTVALAGPWRAYADGQTVILSGYLPHPEPRFDADLIYADPEWVRLKAKADLLGRKRDRDSAQWAVEFTRQAELRRPLLVTAFRPNTALLDR